MEILSELLSDRIDYLNALRIAQNLPVPEVPAAPSIALPVIVSPEIPVGTSGTKTFEYALLIGSFILFVIVVRNLNKTIKKKRKNAVSDFSMTAGNQIILNTITPEELVELFRPMLKDMLFELFGEREEKLLSPAEACKIFEPNISKTTLASWTKQGLIDDHRIGGKVYYRRSEIILKSKTLKKYKNNLQKVS